MKGVTAEQSGILHAEWSVGRVAHGKGSPDGALARFLVLNLMNDTHFPWLL